MLDTDTMKAKVAEVFIKEKKKPVEFLSFPIISPTPSVAKRPTQQNSGFQSPVVYCTLPSAYHNAAWPAPFIN